MYKKFLVFLFLFGIVYAFNFGSTVKLNNVILKENQSTVFSILLWTSDETNQKVILTVISKPDSWNVNLEREEIEISRYSGNEMVYTPDYIHATSVNVFADPNNSKPGYYSVIISAKTVPTTGELAVSQERIFNLTAEIEGKKTAINIDIPFETIEPQSQNNYNFPMIIFVIIFISFLIYKYS